MNDTLMQFSGEPVSIIEETVNGVGTTETKLSKVQLIANIAVLASHFPLWFISYSLLPVETRSCPKAA